VYLIAKTAGNGIMQLSYVESKKPNASSIIASTNPNTISTSLGTIKQTVRPYLLDWKAR